MSKHNTMTYKETVEELEFAIEHNTSRRAMRARGTKPRRCRF